jgi:long-chain fatty acid transport protein
MNPMTKRPGGAWRSGLAALALLAAGTPAWPNNGLNLIGFGTESVGMGGADLAVARDTTALNTNPAGIARLRGAALDVFVEAVQVRQRHADGFGNDRGVNNDLVGLGGFGWTLPVGPDLVAGIGLFGQGGAGFVYRDLNTAFGSRDSVALIFGIARLTPALAWQATPALRLGMALPVSFAIAKQEFFPGTSRLDAGDPSRSFFGTRLTGMRSMNRAGLRLGMQFQASDDWTLAAVYATRTRLPLDHGELAVNLSALGLGTVTYRDVHIDGLGLPQEVGVGAAWQATRRTLVSFELTRLAWSRVLRAQSLTASNPDNPAAPPLLQQSLALDWRDQTVLALGVAHEIAPRWTLYGGLNHGRNPVPARTTSPFFAPIGENHLTLGVRHGLAPGWELAGTFERLLAKTVRYDNPQLPFGAGASERSAYRAMHLMLGRRW